MLLLHSALTPNAHASHADNFPNTLFVWDVSKLRLIAVLNQLGAIRCAVRREREEKRREEKRREEKRREEKRRERVCVCVSM